MSCQWRSERGGRRWNLRFGALPLRMKNQTRQRILSHVSKAGRGLASVGAGHEGFCLRLQTIKGLATQFCLWLQTIKSPVDKKIKTSGGRLSDSTPVIISRKLFSFRDEQTARAIEAFPRGWHCCRRIQWSCKWISRIDPYAVLNYQSLGRVFPHPLHVCYRYQAFAECFHSPSHFNSI